MIDGRRAPFEALRDGCVHVWTLSVSAAADEPGHTPCRLPKPRRLGRGAKAAEWAVQRSLIRRRSREILSSYLACPPERVPIERSARGKPALRVAEAGDLAYSVTHSGAFACLAVARGRRVGIDLERVRPTADVAALATRFLSREEAAAIVSLRDRSRRVAFFRAWTRKEAYLKAVGGGVPAALRRFSVSVDSDRPPELLSTELEGGDSAFSLYDVRVPDGYLGALAIEGTGHRIRYMAS